MWKLNGCAFSGRNGRSGAAAFDCTPLLPQGDLERRRKDLEEELAFFVSYRKVAVVLVWDAMGSTAPGPAVSIDTRVSACLNSQVEALLPSAGISQALLPSAGINQALLPC